MDLDLALSRIPVARKLRLYEQLKKLPSSQQSVQESVSRANPREFILDVLGEKPSSAALSYGYTVPWTPDQGDLYQAIEDGNTRIAVFSGHGCGKSASVARIALWGLYENEGNIVITTAPTKRQVEIVLWNQIRSVFGKSKTPLPGRVMQTKIAVSDDQFAYGFTAAVGNEDYAATKTHGIHAKNRTIIIVDEAAGVHDLVLESILSLALREQDIIILIGNPTAIGSAYHKACQSWQKVLRFSCLNHPNVRHGDQDIIKGAVTRSFCAEIKDTFGEDSAQYKAKVLGEWPEHSPDTLITLSNWADAQKLWTESRYKNEPDDFGCAAGIDIGGEGADLTVLSIVKNGIWEIPRLKKGFAWHAGKDETHAVDLVLSAYEEGLPIRVLVVDDTGAGRVVTGMLRRLQNEGKLPRFAIIGKQTTQKPWIMPLNFGGSAFQKDKFYNIKSELWWNAREFFRKGMVGIPDDDALAKYNLPKGQSMEKQITSPIYANYGGRATIVLDKRSSGTGRLDETVRQQVKHLPEKSPDIAHSFILALWGWKILSGQKPIDKETAPSSLQEWWNMKIKEALTQPKKARAALAPWQRQ